LSFYSECVFIALVTRFAQRMRRIILPSVDCLALPGFPHYLKKDTIFGEKKISLNTIFVF